MCEESFFLKEDPPNKINLEWSEVEKIQKAILEQNNAQTYNNPNGGMKTAFVNFQVAGAEVFSNFKDFKKLRSDEYSILLNARD